MAEDSIRVGQDVDTNRGRVTGVDSSGQQVRIDLGSRTPAELQKVVDIVLGDGFRWDGVVREIRKLDESLTSQMQSMEQRLEKRIEAIEKKLDLTPNTNLDRNLLIAIMVSVVLFGLILAWGIYVISNGGVTL